MTNDRFYISARVHARVVGDDLVILDLNAGDYFSLDAVGREVWLEIEHGASRDEIVRTIASRYDAPADTIARDVDALLADLAGRGLLTRTPLTSDVPDDV